MYFTMAIFISMSSSLAFVIVIVAAAEGGGHFQGKPPNPYLANLEKKINNEKTIY